MTILKIEIYFVVTCFLKTDDYHNNSQFCSLRLTVVSPVIVRLSSEGHLSHLAVRDVSLRIILCKNFVIIILIL